MMLPIILPNGADYINLAQLTYFTVHGPTAIEIYLSDGSMHLLMHENAENFFNWYIGRPGLTINTSPLEAVA